MRMKLQGTFKKQMTSRVGSYRFSVGVENKRHRAAKSAAVFGHKSFNGGPARKIGKPSDITIAEIADNLIGTVGVNYWTHPFKQRSSDIIRFTDTFMKLTFGKKNTVNRAENLLQAVVRNPILRGDYGVNSVLTAKIKGFNRLMIDTGQFFNSIKARVYRSGKRVV